MLTRHKLGICERVLHLTHLKLPCDGIYQNSTPLTKALCVHFIAKLYLLGCIRCIYHKISATLLISNVRRTRTGVAIVTGRITSCKLAVSVLRTYKP